MYPSDDVAAKEGCCDRQHNRNTCGKDQCGKDKPPQGGIVACAEGLRDRNGHAAGAAIAEAKYEEGDGSACTYGRQALYAEEIAHYGRVRQQIELLQDVPKEDGNGEGQKEAESVPLGEFLGFARRHIHYLLTGRKIMKKISIFVLHMRLVIQRVSEASVTVDGECISAIGRGLLVLVGVENGDTEQDAAWLAAKTAALRIFDDEDGVMNRSVVDIDGELLAVSQFTLTASTRKGNRPSYIRAAGHELAVPLYERFCALLAEAAGRPVLQGRFGADMKVRLLNDGPVTILIDSRLKE